jgi:hypothetical protein
VSIIVSFPQTEAELLEPQIDRLIEAHSLTELDRMFGMGTVDIELSGEQGAVNAFAEAVAVLGGAHCTAQP